MSIMQICNACKARQPLSCTLCKKCSFALSKDRSPKRYLVLWRESGRQRKESCQSLTAARYREKQVKVQIAEGRVIEKDKNALVPLGELLTWYLDLDTTQAKASWKRDEQYANHLKRLLRAETLIRDLSQGRLERYLVKRTQEPSGCKNGVNVAPATADKELQCLRVALNKGVEHGKLSSNPVKKLPQLNTDNCRERIITEKEYQSLLDHLPDHLTGVVELAYRLGMRQSEVVGLTWNEVDLKQKIITLSASRTKESKKKHIPLIQRTDEILLCLDRGIHEDPVFLRNGKRFRWDSSCRRAWERACTLAEVEDLHFHDLRHSCITNLVLDGYPLSFIMKMTGHSNFNTHSRYVNLNPSHMWEMVKKSNQG